MFFQLEEDERRLSKLSIRDEEVGLESDEEETGMIFKGTNYQTTRLQQTTKDNKRQQKTAKDNKRQHKTTKDNIRQQKTT